MSSGRKFIVVLGSIMSGLGKGILTASIGRLLKTRGYKVTPIKFDGYMNVDCGTMNPFRHGEVFVLDDGGEVDMDFGTYERFLNFSLPSRSSITGGKMSRLILEKERRGDYLGRDVQVVPHLTNEIKTWIKAVGEEHCILSTDFGQTLHPTPPEGFRMMVAYMIQFGLSEKEIEIKIKFCYPT